MYQEHYKNEKTIIKTVQELLLSEEDKSLITPEKITETVDSLLSMNLYAKFKENLDYDFVIDELIRRNSIWIGEDNILINNIDHVPWLTIERKKEWRYWERYKEWQEKKLAWTSLNALDKSTDEILGLLEDPTRTDAWDRRGLVVGHVQSGKTGNFTGLICKAADAGYKIIIVLAGMHNNLRSQTQMRLDEGFLGYETHPDPEKIKIIGVGELDSGLRPNYVTNRTDKGDFNKNLADIAGIRPEERPWLFVVKKNKTVLKRLHKWIHDHVANTIDQKNQQKIVTNLPLLVIDDEADHASVDTGEQIFNQDGVPEENYEPKAINSLIRQILNLFARKAYVGYTATPFANIYIHEQGETKKEGKDLFPEAFIYNLASPSNYIGPSRVFGFNDGAGARMSQLSIIKEIDDHNTHDGMLGWMPTKHKSDHKPYHESEFGIPLSLVEAINAFILSCAVRQIRKQRDEHSSMLIHVTRFNLVQKEVFEKVDEYIKKISQRLIRGIDNQGILSRLEQLWEHDFIPINAKMKIDVPDLCMHSLPSWKEVKELLPEVIEQVSVRMINGTAKDALDYADSANGLKVIAIGGDKLARGLTLEGLCVSYFLRASKMYDTLMQMGRWFGYRTGYLDVCRLYTTSELREWFEHIADASLELREEFNLMVESGGTPRDYGLKVKSHPVLMVTSPLKMRTAKTLKLSFSGTISETVSFLKDEKTLKNNFNALMYLFKSLGEPHTKPLRFRERTNSQNLSSNNFYWENISYTHVLDFLEQYETHPESLKANSKMLKSFIEKMVEGGQLTSWNIAFMGGSIKDNPVHLSDSIILQRAQRTSNGRHEDRYAIRRLLSPTDEALDLSNEEWDAALIRTIKNYKAENPGKPVSISHPSGINSRYIRGNGVNGNDGRPEQGLLIIYFPEDVENNNSEEQSLYPFVGFACSFPHSKLSKDVEYKVNNIEWESYYGPAS
ncbi:Z1 domain-containing protein [Acinetobacter baumannii]|uniref:Z1 domain-containing protein n=1 Tax=Acinetobacter baumannii TaxID=470 RepID=UPI0008DD771F|nr:Z1 domain-containing protein [Acinetobacter baumannii]MDB0302213.1 endonuclease [Acinetobacter baumannii]MDC5341806.1 Z1 domain-containing protein [Acinetobacter baumannii]MDC5395524.1 Z1 domain-containing protein [Acinetobacter baumannii]OIF73990.1 endonuclease [Acinetobacter baumannii]